MKRRLLLILPALQQLRNYEFRLIKYSRFPPLSLLTIAGLTPSDRWEILVRDDHVESSEVGVDVDLVGIQTYISSSGRAYELADRWRRRGAKVVLGGLHPTSLPGTLKRIAYNLAWMKVDPLWVAIIRAGLMPFARRIFERVLRVSTKAGKGRSVVQTSGHWECGDSPALSERSQRVPKPCSGEPRRCLLEANNT